MKKTFALIMALALTITLAAAARMPALKLAAQRLRMPTSALWPMAI